MRLLFFLLVVCGLFPVYAQDQEIIKSTVVDGKTNEPLGFVTVRLKNKGTGVITNAGGDFQLPASLRSFQDTIIVSSIGYNTGTVFLHELSTQVINIIRLYPSTTRLNEVLITSRPIRRLTGLKIVQIAIANIPFNFPTKPYSYIGYYRDYQVRDSAYINLNEAIVEVFDEGFHKNDQLTTQLRLLTYQPNKDFKIDTATEIAYDNKSRKFIPTARLSSFGGNELSILRVHDAIRNNNVFSYSFVGAFNKDFVENHLFMLVGSTYVDNIPLYIVEFTALVEASGPFHTAKGKIYIEKNNFAIHKLEYTVTSRKENKIRLLYEINLEYSRIGKLMYFNYVSFNNAFKMANPNDFKVEHIDLSKELNGFKVYFNEALDKTTAVEKKNYDFRVRGNKLDIDSVYLDPFGNTREVFVIVNQSDLNFNLRLDGNAIIPNITAAFKNIRNTKGQTINVITYLYVYQFREIFVQKMNPEGKALPDSSLLMDKAKPLSADTLSGTPDEVKSYWMNTPLKKN